LQYDIWNFVGIDSKHTLGRPTIIAHNNAMHRYSLIIWVWGVRHSTERSATRSPKVVKTTDDFPVILFRHQPHHTRSQCGALPLNLSVTVQCMAGILPGARKFGGCSVEWMPRLPRSNAIGAFLLRRFHPILMHSVAPLSHQEHRPCHSPASQTTDTAQGAFAVCLLRPWQGTPMPTTSAAGQRATVVAACFFPLACGAGPRAHHHREASATKGAKLAALPRPMVRPETTAKTGRLSGGRFLSARSRSAFRSVASSCAITPYSVACQARIEFHLRQFVRCR
jgi:hypothetical protein